MYVGTEGPIKEVGLFQLFQREADDILIHTGAKRGAGELGHTPLASQRRRTTAEVRFR